MVAEVIRLENFADFAPSQTGFSGRRFIWLVPRGYSPGVGDDGEVVCYPYHNEQQVDGEKSNMGREGRTEPWKYHKVLRTISIKHN